MTVLGGGGQGNLPYGSQKRPTPKNIITTVNNKGSADVFGPVVPKAAAVNFQETL